MKNRIKIPLRYVLFILVFACTGLMIASYINPAFSDAVTGVGYRILAPMQNSLSRAGTEIADIFTSFSTISALREENEELKARIEELEEQNRLLYQNTYELEDLRELMQTVNDYTQYDMVAARIIQRSNGNWYNEFVINKGTDDGIYLGANVMADGALVGRVTYAGSNYSKILAIIDDTSNVGAVSMDNSTYCVVSGNTDLYSEGLLLLQYIDANDVIKDGELIVTSNISDVYFEGLAIGYASGVNLSTNNLTQSGYLTPIVNFSDLSEVLVIITPNTLDEASEDNTVNENVTDDETQNETAEEPQEEGD